MTLLSSISLQVSRAKKCSFMCNFSKKRKVYVYWNHPLFISKVKHLCSLSLGVWKWNKNPFWDFFLLLFALTLGWCKFFWVTSWEKSARTYFSYGTCYMKCVCLSFFFFFSLKSTLKRKKKCKPAEKVTEVNYLSIQLAIFRKGLGIGWVEKKGYIFERGKDS